MDNSNFDPESRYEVATYAFSNKTREQKYDLVGDHIYFDRFLNGIAVIYIKFGDYSNKWIQIEPGQTISRKFNQFWVTAKFDGWVNKRADVGAFGNSGNFNSQLPVVARFWVSHGKMNIERAINSIGFDAENLACIAGFTNNNVLSPLWQNLSGLTSYPKGMTGYDRGGTLIIQVDSSSPDPLLLGANWFTGAGGSIQLGIGQQMTFNFRSGQAPLYNIQVGDSLGGGCFFAVWTNLLFDLSLPTGPDAYNFNN